VTKKILLIDDDDLVLRSIEKLLKNHDYAVSTAMEYSKALEVIAKENFDLIISDIRIPEKNGTEIVSDIQNSLKQSGKRELPIIFITGYAGEDLRLNASFLGETLYKPIDINKLLTTIRDYL
jgi:CheY-like chemotaxis protein